MTPKPVASPTRRARAILLRAIVFVGIAALLVGAGTVGLSVNTAGRSGSGPATAVDMVEQSLRGQGTPDAVIATFEKGEIAESRALGNEDYGPDTPFFIGSASKSLTAMTVARLVQQDRLDFDDRVVSHLPWFRVQGAYADITVRHLLNQTSGLPQWAGQVDLFQPELKVEERVRELATVQMTAEPGEKFQYCNKNYAVLGMIIEAVTGRPYADVLKSEVLDPLGMSHTYTSTDEVDDGELPGGNLVMFGAHVPWPTPDFPAALADGYMISTARDLAAFADTLSTGEHDGRQFLSPAVLGSVQTPPDGVASDPAYGSTYGMGLRISDIRGRQVLWHEGELATFHANFGVFADDRSGVLVLIAQNHQVIDGDSPFMSGLNVTAGGDARSDDGGYRSTMLSLIVVAALLVTAMIADISRLPRKLHRRRARRLVRHVVPRTIVGVLLTSVTFIGLGLGQGLPGPMPLEMAWTGAPDVTVLVLGTSAYLLISAAVLAFSKEVGHDDVMSRKRSRTYSSISWSLGYPVRRARLRRSL